MIPRTLPYLSLSVKPALPADACWCLHIGAWDDPEMQVLEGFASSFDAWAFAVANGIGDPASGIPAGKFRKYFNRPPVEPEEKIEQMTLVGLEG